jgi:hypothetical protein
MLFKGILGIIVYMININPEGPELTMEEQEDNLSLHQYLILREKAKVELLKLDDLDEGFDVTIQEERLKKEIAELEEKIEELGGEKDIAA